MDSAVQRHLKPSPIRWSTRPDTLHMPGQTEWVDYRDFSLPKYYKESFFSKDSLFHPELRGGRLGVAGDPVPYTLAGDDMFTSLLLGCFLLGMVAFAQSRRFITHYTKHFFRVQRTGITAFSETSVELRFMLFLVLQTCLMTALWLFNYKALTGEAFIIEPYQVVSIYAAAFGCYILLKLMAYALVGWTFFTGSQNSQWSKAFLFIVAAEGILIFPVVLLQTYFGISVKAASIYIIVIAFCFKVLTLYKEYLIFFRQKGRFLQLFLYFCALEITPALILWKALVTTTSYLKISF